MERQHSNNSLRAFVGIISNIEVIAENVSGGSGQFQTRLLRAKELLLEMSDSKAYHSSFRVFEINRLRLFVQKNISSLIRDNLRYDKNIVKKFRVKNMYLRDKFILRFVGAITLAVFLTTVILSPEGAKNLSLDSSAPKSVAPQNDRTVKAVSIFSHIRQQQAANSTGTEASLVKALGGNQDDSWLGEQVRRIDVYSIGLCSRGNFCNEDVAVVPVKDNSIVSNSKSINFTPFAFYRISIMQRVAGRDIESYLLNNKSLDLRGEFLQLLIGVFSERIAGHLRLKRCSISLEETRPDFLDFSISSQKLGLEYSIDSNKSSNASLSKKNPLVLSPFALLSKTKRTKPFNAFAGLTRTWESFITFSFNNNVRSNHLNFFLINLMITNYHFCS